MEWSITILRGGRGARRGLTAAVVCIATMIIVAGLNGELASVADVPAAGNTVGGCTGFTCRPRGDLDSDHDVDLTDYNRFLECLSGAKTAAADDCEYADFDCDGYVDLADIGYFQAAFSGSW